MKKWIIKNTNTGLTKLHSNEFLNRLLLSREIDNSEEANLFLNPSLEDLYDPFMLQDMNRAIERIDEVIKKGQKIAIYGDYDVDGITSTSILFRAFKKLGIDVSYYLPDRINEGYGLNFQAINYLKSLKTDLIITVDCGISAFEEVKYIKSLGMDVIITDHHECREDIPDTIVINPKRQDCNYPCKNLAGCGVAFKLIEALWMYYDIEGVDEFLDIAAIGTIADVVELKGENRIIAKQGMEKLKTTDKCGLIALKKIAGVEDRLTSGAVAFQIAPRVNAIGRLSDAKIAVELFTTSDYDKAMQIAKYLDQENRSRQVIEEEILSEVIDKVNDEVNLKEEKVIVVSSPKWHIGVVGIVASKVVELFHRPAIILCEEEDGTLRGSCRSIEGFNMFKALEHSSSLLNGFGGHEMAAGLQIDKENIDCLKEKLNDFAETVDIDAYISKIRIDMVLEGDDITLANVDAIKSLEPFGMGNPTPIFGMEDMFINSKRYIGTGDKHMKIQFEKDDISYEGILFNYGANYMDKDWKNVDIAFNLDENNWMGKSTIQFIIKDMKPYKKWIKESLKENYYKYLTKALANKGNDNINLKEVNFIKKDINVIKDFLCFEKGYVLVSSKESLDELNEIFGLFEVEGNILKDTQSGVILCPCVDYIDNCSDVLVYDFLLSETDYKLIKDKGINIHHFYGDDSINKIDSFIEDISINANILEDIITTLQTSSINGRLSVIADRFNINPYQMFSAITFLRKNGIVEILSNSQEIRVSLVIENPTIEFKEDDNIMLHKIKKLRPIIEIYCKEN